MQYAARGPLRKTAPLTVVTRAAALLLAAGLLAGCKGHGAAAPADAGDDAAEPETVEALVVPDAGANATPEQTALVLFATESPTQVMSAPEWAPRDPTKADGDRKGVTRLGYLRKGASVKVKPQIIKKGNCLEGWYALLSGGYICGKTATLDPHDKALEGAPHPPFDDRPLPYDYGLNLTNGTPLYRRAPLRKERAQFERDLAVGKAQVPLYADEGGDKAPEKAGGDKAGGEKPWYLQDHHGQKPLVSFDELKGESSLIDRRMVRGFYLALDAEVRAFAGKFWRTTHGEFVPADHVLVHQGTTEFKGVWFGKDGDTRAVPVAWALGFHVRQYTLDPASDNPERRARRGEHVDRFSVVPLTGKQQVVDDRTYYETRDGWYLRDVDSTLTKPDPPPKDLAKGEKWIDVNLTRQTLVAFEGETPVFATLISSGRHDDTDKAKDHKTPTGTYAIREKHVSATMDDDAASDGPYSIEDVPWIMYFKGGIALHGAFWHSRFGHERSHGCVNLQPEDAKTLFAWVGPALPEGWHGVRATEENPGTRVVVHD